MRDTPLIVASGLFVNPENKILMALRHSTQVPPDRWETPGGKVEPGEGERDALVREMREELGVEVEVGQLISTATLDFDQRMHLILYHCRIVGDKEPQPLESQELRWVDAVHARKQMPCCPANYIFYPDIARFLGIKKG